MSRYASDTGVSAERSRIEIEQVLDKYGASGFFYASEVGRAVIGFRIHGRLVKLTLPLPNPEEFRTVKVFKYGKRQRTPREAERACDRARRQKWRCLLLAIKAKLEIVESGIATFETEFLAHILTHDGRTVGEAVLPRLAESYESGRDIPLLPSGGAL